MSHNVSLMRNSLGFYSAIDFNQHCSRVPDQAYPLCATKRHKSLIRSEGKAVLNDFTAFECRAVTRNSITIVRYDHFGSKWWAAIFEWR